MARKFLKIFFSAFVLLMVFNFVSFSEKGVSFGSSQIVYAVSDEESAAQKAQISDLQNKISGITTQISKLLEENSKLKTDDPGYAAAKAKNQNKLDLLQEQRRGYEAELDKLKQKYDPCGGIGGAIKCSISEAFGGIWNGLAGTILYIVSVIINLILVPLFAMILGLIGILIDLTLHLTINISKLVDTLTSINIAWGYIRDIFNVIFIFTLLYIAIGTILRLSNVNMKKMLSTVVIAAIFVNFSMFMTKTLIDLSNVISLSFYNKITNNGDIDLSEKLMNGAKIPQSFAAAQKKQSASSTAGYGEFTKNGTGVETGLGAVLEGVILLIVMAVTAFAFGSVAFLLLARTAILILLIVTSPVAVAGYVVPFTEKYAKDWLTAFTSQLTVLPIFLILMNVVVGFAEVTGGATTSITPGLSGLNLALRPILDYGLLIAMILLTVSITTKASGAVGAMVTGAIKKGVGIAAGIATGGAALAGSALIGGAASRLNYHAGTYLGEKSLEGGIGGKLASLGLKATNAAQKGTFDIRNTAVGGFIKDKTGINLGKGNKSSYGGRIDEKAKGYVERIKQTEGLAEAKAEAKIEREVKPVQPVDLQVRRNEIIRNKENEITKRHAEEKSQAFDSEQKMIHDLEEKEKALDQERKNAAGDFSTEGKKKFQEIEKNIETAKKEKEAKLTEIANKKTETEKKQQAEMDKHKEEIEEIKKDNEFKKERAQLEAEREQQKEAIRKKEKENYSKAKTDYIEKVENKPGDKGYFGFKMGVASATQRKLVADKIRKLTREKTKEEKQTADLAKEIKRLQDEENKGKKEEKPKEDKEKK